MSLLAVGRLIRLSLAPSAAADAAAGTLVGAAAWPAGPAPWLQVAAALSVYHGGMALNDWRDREHDGRTRPDRPVPSGKVPAPLALALGLALTAGGPALAALASRPSALLLAVVAVGSLAYNLGLRGPLSGPVLLGLCRAGNLGAGLVLGLSLAAANGASTSIAALAPWWPVLFAYGAYVFLLSCLARYEDAEAGPIPGKASLRHPRSFLVAAGLVLALLPLTVLLASEAGGASAATSALLPALGLSVLGAFGLLKRALRAPAWTPGYVLGSMGMGLRRLLIATGALAVTAGGPAGWIVGASILAGYPASYALRRVFPPS